MKLTQNDAELFFKLMNNLLCYVNRKAKVVTNVKLESYMDFTIEAVPFDKVAKLQNVLFSDISIIDEVVKENPYGFNDEEISIIKSWKNFINGRFVIVKHLKKYTTIFTETEDDLAFVYGVKGLYDEIGNMVEEKQMIGMVLLPFKGQITYSGLMNGPGMYLGGGYMSSVMEMYNESKVKYGIIESLPFNPKKDGKSDEELLKEYLKTEKNKDKYWNEIIELRNKNKKLETLFHQERNKLYSKFYKKEYKINDIKLFVAMYEVLPIAIAKNKKDLEKRILEFVPKNKLDRVFIFQNR